MLNTCSRKWSQDLIFMASPDAFKAAWKPLSRIINIQAICIHALSCAGINTVGIFTSFSQRVISHLEHLHRGLS